MTISSPPPPPDRSGALLTLRELALRWRLSTKSIHTLVRTGKVRALRLGCALRFHPEDVRAAESRAATVTNVTAAGDSPAPHGKEDA